MTERPIALVTGGAQGIGYACAEAIAENGAHIVLADINAAGAAAAAAKLGNGAIGLACDMGKPDQVLAMFDRIEADAGPVSILVNNAG
ncbi:MAG: SDR family NAD(P)-dependent oxidoreductase, partial [Hyphomicrobiaceae bacterium]